ncbi:hypothetical protein F5Y18DRAFT_432687 [Xylariaceae sp. FL1019]|nr:hypothetical protein F5Y18DRAFT_432687 [Xylariaceae sp. FL1019]
MHRNATRWLGYMSSSSRALGPITRHDSFLTLAAFSRASHLPPQCPSRRALSTCRGLRNANSPPTPTPGSKTSSASRAEAGPKQHRSKSRFSDFRPHIFVLALGTSLGWAYGYYSRAQKSGDDIINQEKFSGFTVVGREQVSPSAFVITLRPSNADGGEGWMSTRVKEAWQHGLWSVEIKQPQLQIARHYTPLPPEGRGEGERDLRFLIRKMDGGEMSSYLSRQKVGDVIWLRGPWVGFDVPRRLGISDEEVVRGREKERSVVFLAGGTGVAPALQIAHKLLDDADTPMKTKPRVRILWANRHAADALGREKERMRSWFGFGTTRTNPELDVEQQSSLAKQIREMKRRHGENFHIEYFADEEGKFISVRDVENACRSATGTTSGSIDRSCTWHSRAAVRNLPDDHDHERADAVCDCAAPGVNLLCVSGPDGFIQAYAGAKMWHQGNEMQGAIGGILEQLLGTKGMEDWLVLKL